MSMSLSGGVTPMATVNGSRPSARCFPSEEHFERQRWAVLFPWSFGSSSCGL